MHEQIFVELFLENYVSIFEKKDSTEVQAYRTSLNRNEMITNKC